MADQSDPHAEPVPYCGVVLHRGEPERWATVHDCINVVQRSLAGRSEPHEFQGFRTLSFAESDRLAMHGKIALESRAKGGAS